MKAKNCRINLWSVALFLIFAIIFQNKSASSAELRVVILDVGMGQSILLEQSGHALLIDTGSAGQTTSVLKRLQAYTVRALDYLVLTHLHPDHAAGYLQIRQIWPDTEFFAGCRSPDPIESSDRDFLSTISPLLTKDPLYNCLAAGDTLYWQGHRLQILWPTVPTGSNLNTMSLVLLLSTNDGRTVLVMGDTGKQVERELTSTLRSMLQGKRLDLYVAGHHAAADSTDKNFLRILKPVFSAVSVGRSNPYGYPSDRALDILQQFSNKMLRTDQDGELCFSLRITGIFPCTMNP